MHLNDNSVFLYYRSMITIRRETYLAVSGTIFLVVGLLHGVRALNEWRLVIDNFTVPVSWSWIAFIVAFFLAYSAFHLKK